MRPKWLSWATLSLLIAGGCNFYHYELELRPAGDQIDRRLTCWKTAELDRDSKLQDFPSEELQAIAATYGATISQSLSSKHTFAAPFDGTTPQDIGGSGWYRRFQSPLGDLYWYMERFKGRDDLVVQLEERTAAADQLADLLKGWMSAELGDVPELASAVKVVDVDLRHDLKNFGTYTWTASSLPSHGAAEKDANGVDSFYLSALQYFIERGYLTPDELPKLQRNLSTSFEAMIGRALLRKSGLLESHAGDERLACLFDPDRARESWERYLRTTPQFQTQLDAWEVAKQSDPATPEPDPQAIFSDSIVELIDFQLFGRQDNVTLTLYTPTQPFLTNSTWDADKKAAVWKLSLVGETGVPTLVHAQWAVPNKDLQTRFLGSVVLADDQLAEYANWYIGLTDDERAEWDRFVEQLRPAPGLARHVAEFQFHAESAEAPDEAVLGYLRSGRDQLARALEQAAPKKPAEN